MKAKPKGRSKSPLSFITKRFGTIGLLGLPAALAGVSGLVAAMNWDTWFGGQNVNVIGPNQMNAMLGAVAVAGLGVFLTVLGMVRARAHPVRPTEELAPAPAPQPAPVIASVAPPPARVSIPEPEVKAAPELAPQPEAIEEEEEEEDEFVLPPSPSPPVSPAPPARAEAFAPPAALPVPAPVVATPPPTGAAERDELEDLFGELESEVAKAEEDEIHYECPNCHGIVREDDASCPHCHVTFEA